MSEIKKIADLRDDLLQAYQQLRDGKMTDAHAKEVANMAGKIINTLKVELSYDSYHKIEDRINFMDKTTENE